MPAVEVRKWWFMVGRCEVCVRVSCTEVGGGWCDVGRHREQLLLQLRAVETVVAWAALCWEYRWYSAVR